MRANRREPRTDGRGQSGFSVLEMLLASAIMMVGIISVVQLVPASLQLNANNRLDTMATVIAQRELDQMMSQPLTVNSFKDVDGNVISLGGSNSPGSPVVKDPQTGMEQIDFGANKVPGFFLSYVDPNDPNPANAATFDVRWAVIPQLNPPPPATAGRVISRRIIMGCRQTNAKQLMLPVNLDTWVHR